MVSYSMSMATNKKITHANEMGGSETIIAAKAGIAKVSQKGSGRFVKKDKKRLPRKEKKQLSKITPI